MAVAVNKANQILEIIRTELTTKEILLSGIIMVWRFFCILNAVRSAGPFF